MTHLRALFARRVHSVRHNVQSIVEQVAVPINRRGLVAEHLLHDLHIRTRGDSQWRLRVP
jgi:hypothetical protein